MRIQFPVGYRAAHPVEQINYQINRWLPVADEAEFVAAAQVTSMEDWAVSMLALAERAAGDGRDLHASTYFRAAEFFLPFDDPRKLAAYRRYRVHVARVDVGRPYVRDEVP